MQLYDSGIEIVLLIFFGIIGLCLGSFATAIIYREQRGQSWFLYKGHSARSCCPHCGVNLRPRELVPVFSWLFLKGRCGNCRAPIPFFYPFIEIVSGSCALMIFCLSGVGVVSFTALFCLPFVISLVYLGVVHKSFSWRLVIILAMIGLAAFCFKFFLIR